MSVVIGIKTEHSVWLACDKQITTGDKKQFLQAPHSKVCLVPDRPKIAIGSVGYLRGINLLETNNSYIDEACYLRDSIDYAYMVNGFPVLVSELFASQGFLPIREEGNRKLDLINEFLVGTSKSLFEVGADGSVIEQTIASIGSGDELAYGVLQNGYKTNMNDKQVMKLLKQAIQAASYNTGCGGGGVLINVSKNEIYEF